MHAYNINIAATLEVFQGEGWYALVWQDTDSHSHIQHCVHLYLWNRVVNAKADRSNLLAALKVLNQDHPRHYTHPDLFCLHCKCQHWCERQGDPGAQHRCQGQGDPGAQRCCERHGDSTGVKNKVTLEHSAGVSNKVTRAQVCSPTVLCWPTATTSDLATCKSGGVAYFW